MILIFINASRPLAASQYKVSDELLCKELRVEEHERVDDLLAEEQNIQSSAQICFMIRFL